MRKFTLPLALLLLVISSQIINVTASHSASYRRKLKPPRQPPLRYLRSLI